MVTLTILGIVILAAVIIILVCGGLILTLFGDVILAFLVIAGIVKLCKWISKSMKKSK